MTTGPDDRAQEQQALPGARAAVALLLGINLFNYIDRYVLAAVEPAIRQTYFGGDVENAMARTGQLATYFLLSYMLAAPICGWLADRMSRWVLVGISVILWSLATGASGLAGTFGLLILARVFVGIGEAGYGPAAPTIIADLYPVARRGRVLAWFYAAIPVGSALGYAIGGVLAKYFGWRWAFFGVVGPGIVLGIMAFFFRDPRALARAPVQRRAKPALHKAPARRRAEPAPPKAQAKWGDYLQLARIPSYVIDCAGMTLLTFAIGGISYWMPAYLVDRGAGDLGHVNLVFGGVVVVAGLSATLLGGWAGDALRRYVSGSYFAVSAGGMFAAAPLVVAMLYVPFPAAWGVIFLAVFCLFFNTGPSNTILANVTAPAIRATAFAVNILVIHALGDALAPWALGRIVGPKIRIIDGASVAVKQWNAAFWLVACLIVLGGAVWLGGMRFLERDTRRAEGATG